MLRFTGCCPLLPPLTSLLTRVTETAVVADAEAAAFGETAAEDLEEEFPLRERGESGAGDCASRCLMLSLDPSSSSSDWVKLLPAGSATGLGSAPTILPSALSWAILNCGSMFQSAAASLLSLFSPDLLLNRSCFSPS